MKTAFRWVVVAVAAFAFCVVAWSLSAKPLFLAYLAAVLFPWSVSVGSIALMLMIVLTGGKWGLASWPWLAINARLMPLVAILFLPVMFGIDAIYPWANSNLLQQFEHTENRQWFYQVPFFIGRSVFYFIVWSALGWMNSGMIGERIAVSKLADDAAGKDDNSPLVPPMIVGGQATAGLGLIALLLTITWASFDWIMSLDPFFGSTLLGALIGMGALLSAMSGAVAAVCFWSPLFERSIDETTLGDLASLLLAFLMLWAYFSFAHFLIMWMGNLPIEAKFYAVRNEGVWAWVVPVLSLGGFVIPFLCLLSYRFKRTPKMIGTLAGGLLLVRIVELWWMVLPANGAASGSSLPWALFPATVAVVSSYVAGLVWMGGRLFPLATGEISHVR